MTKGAELLRAIKKGIGLLPTSFLLRWSPSFSSPLRFDLIEVSRCETDGLVVTPTMSQSDRGLHAGHRVKSPKTYSLFEFLKVQLRVIR